MFDQNLANEGLNFNFFQLQSLESILSHSDENDFETKKINFNSD